MKCLHCGASVHRRAKFCENCGAELDPAGQAAGNSFKGESYFDSAQADLPGVYATDQASGVPFALSIIALVCGFLWLSPVGIVLGVIALVMNVNQKKRGEESSKQTPTTVIGVIGILVSTITLILTLVFAGAVMDAIQNGAVGEDGNLAIPGITVIATEDVVGTWEISSWSDDGQAASPEELQMMKLMGFRIVLRSDGSAAMSMLGERLVGTWNATGIDTVHIAFPESGTSFDATIADDAMTLTYDDALITFTRA